MRAVLMSCVCLQALLMAASSAFASTDDALLDEVLIPAPPGIDQERLYYTLSDIERIVEQYDKRPAPHEHLSRWHRWVVATGIVTHEGEGGEETLAPRELEITIRAHLEWPDHIENVFPDGRHRRQDILEFSAHQRDDEPPRFAVTLIITEHNISMELSSEQMRSADQARALFAVVSERIERGMFEHGFDHDSLGVFRDVHAALVVQRDAHRRQGGEGWIRSANYCGVDPHYRASLIGGRCEVSIANHGRTVEGYAAAVGSGDVIEFRIDDAHAARVLATLREMSREPGVMRAGSPRLIRVSR